MKAVRMYAPGDLRVEEVSIPEIEEDEVVGGFVGHDLGIAIVPDMAVYDLLPIKKIKIKDLEDQQTFYMTYLKENEKSKAFKQFIDYVVGEKNDW